MNAIEIRRVTKQFGSVVAVNDLSLEPSSRPPRAEPARIARHAAEFQPVARQRNVRTALEVPEGAIYRFIGPNGSGKTTTMRMIMNIILPDSGEISVLGQRRASAARDAIGYLPEERGLYKKMTARCLLRDYGRLKGRSLAQVDAAQKVQFIAAIVPEPRLLIADTGCALLGAGPRELRSPQGCGTGAQTAGHPDAYHLL